MASRIILALFGFVGLAGFAAAEGGPTNADAAVRQDQASAAGRVTLDIHWLTIRSSNNYALRQNGQDKLPKAGATTIIDNQLASSLKTLVSHDRWANDLSATGPLHLVSGEETKSPNPGLSGLNSYRATVSRDGKSVEIDFTFFKTEDEKDRIPAVSATVPLGSSMLLHAKHFAITERTGSGLGDTVDKLFGLAKTQVVKADLYLLVTPSVAGAE
jgi:hypothetical protein